MGQTTREAIEWTATCFVDTDENSDPFRTGEVKFGIMAGSKYSDEFKEQIVAEVNEKSRPVSEVAKAYGLVPQTVGNWVNKWRRTHPDNGGEELTAAELAELKKVKAQLREAQMEIEFLKKAAAFFARESR